MCCNACVYVLCLFFVATIPELNDDDPPSLWQVWQTNQTPLPYHCGHICFSHITRTHTHMIRATTTNTLDGRTTRNTFQLRFPLAHSINTSQRRRNIRNDCFNLKLFDWMIICICNRYRFFRCCCMCKIISVDNYARDLATGEWIVVFLQNALKASISDIPTDRQTTKTKSTKRKALWWTSDKKNHQETRHIQSRNHTNPHTRSRAPQSFCVCVFCAIGAEAPIVRRIAPKVCVIVHLRLRIYACKEALNVYISESK